MTTLSSGQPTPQDTMPPFDLKRARERAGLTQEELAEKIGITSNHYARLERGEFPLKRQTLLAICAALGLRIPKEGKDG